MLSEDAFEITWEQLPQRSTWLESEPPDPHANGGQEAIDQIDTPYPARTPAGKQPGGWEFLDHTADVQIHSWGANLGEAFGAAAVGMFAYMVELHEIDNGLEVQIAIHCHDMNSLLYSFLDECLYCFHTQQFVAKEVIVKYIDTQNWKMGAVVRGGIFDVSRHSQGTEVKAITYSNMQVVDVASDKVEVFVIVDI